MTYHRSLNATGPGQHDKYTRRRSGQITPLLCIQPAQLIHWHPELAQANR